MSGTLHPGTRVRQQGTKQTGVVYQLVADERVMVKWDDGRFAREHVEDLVVASVVDELAGVDVRNVCDPQVLRALCAELHQHQGGHQAEVQNDMAKLSTVTARTLLHVLQGQRTALNKARSQPWRKVP